MDPPTTVNENVSLVFQPSTPSSPSILSSSEVLALIPAEAPEPPPVSSLGFPKPVAPKRTKRLSLVSFMPRISDQDELSAPPSTPGEPFDPRRVTALDLAHTKLASLNHLASNIHLHSLNLSYSDLYSLAGLDQLCHLQVLNLEGCGLRDLRFSLASLKSLHAANNAITSVELDCPHLEYLDLDNNQVEALAPLASVRELRIRNNFSALDLDKWTSLSVLYGEGNTVRGLDKHRLRMLSWDRGTVDPACLENAQIALCYGPQMPTLTNGVYPIQHLTLSGMGLTELPSWFSKRLPCLKVLDLGDNQLDNSCFSVLSGLTYLRGLSLASNNFSVLDDLYMALCPLGQLGILDLRNNPLTKTYYAGGVVQTIQSLVGVPYLQYFKLLKSLGIWWLDGFQIAHGSSRRTWHNDILLELAAVRPDQGVWVPDSPGEAGVSVSTLEPKEPDETLDEQARIILRILMADFQKTRDDEPLDEWIGPPEVPVPEEQGDSRRAQGLAQGLGLTGAGLHSEEEDSQAGSDFYSM